MKVPQITVASWHPANQLPESLATLAGHLDDIVRPLHSVTTDLAAARPQLEASLRDAHASLDDALAGLEHLEAVSGWARVNEADGSFHYIRKVIDDGATISSADHATWQNALRTIQDRVDATALRLDGALGDDADDMSRVFNTTNQVATDAYTLRQHISRLV